MTKTARILSLHPLTHDGSERDNAVGFVVETLATYGSDAATDKAFNQKAELGSELYFQVVNILTSH